MNIDRPFSTPIFYTQLENEKLFDIQEEIGKNLKDYCLQKFCGLQICLKIEFSITPTR
mgnify:CR=1 FL=1